ncbi:hypothetical protein A9G11_09590 [Gilliamella sp. wkB108]|uniref:MFS transporter n=1 Tax=Gilliamella sp. wkB108 TaxID=3120256 RepID=UPI00080DEC11|nr:MFS transporter [Gilliamella apicola]OCG20937.1 hypothetical protein A9G11_09590 [Gilliamella apicola]
MNFIKNYGLVMLIGLAGFISAADNWVASLLLPNIATDFGLTISQVSIVLTAYLIPYGVLQPFYGFYSDKYGRKNILLALMLLLSLATLLCSFAQNLMLLTIYRFITGLFAAGIVAVSLGILGELYKNEILTKLVGIFLGLIFLGQGLSSAIGGWLIEISTWRNIFLIFSILSLLSFMTIFSLPTSPKHMPKSNFIPTTILLLKNKRLLVVYFLAFGNGFIVLGSYSFIGSYFFKSLNIDYKYVGLGLMLFGLACFFTGFINRIFLKNIAPKNVIILGLSCTLISLLLYCCNSVAFAYLATMMLGIGYILVQSILASKALELAGDNKGLSSGLIGVAIFGGGGIGTYLGSFILNVTHYKILFSIYIGLLLVLLGFVFKRLKF